MREVVIVSAVRTAIGSFGGSLKDVPSSELGAIVIKEAVNRAGIKPELVEEVVMGNVIQAAQGQNVARQAAVKAGLPVEVPAMTINKVCGSGLRCVALAAQMIKAGDCDVVVAGGMENMSAAPYAVPGARWGQRMGDGKIVDTMIKDALWDAFNNYHMGVTAENIAKEWGLTREMQDEFSLNSQLKAEKAIKEGRFVDEIVQMAKLKPAFIKDGTVTAANASGINDGAAAFVVMSAEKAAQLGLKSMAKILSYGSKGLDPSIMGYGPFHATKKALEGAGLTVEDMDLIEANEAFAAQSLAVAKDLNFDMNKVNVNGGAIALGHPVGASGARILVTLLHEMQKRDAKKGLATLCIGGGMGTALVVERE